MRKSKVGSFAKHSRYVFFFKTSRYVYLMLMYLKQLRSFMRLHSGPSKPRKTNPAVLPAAPVFGHSAVHEKPHRAPQETEAYIHLYYPTRIITHVERRVIEEDHHGPKINVIRQVAREMYEKEDEETRAAVLAYVAAEAEKTDMTQTALAEAEVAENPTPQQYQQ